MKISKAIMHDLDSLYAITKSCGSHLINKGIFQWNEFYPSIEVLKKDIHLQQIWKLVENNCIIGLIVITEIEDLVYKKVQWLSVNDNNVYVHRLAVDPEYQGKGYGQQLMSFAEKYCTDKGYRSIRLDTFSQNMSNQKFYENRNYQKLEKVYFLNQSEHPFYCYEKILNA